MAAGVRLGDLRVSTPAITDWIVWSWIGMEAGMTLGTAGEHGQLRKALAAVAALLQRVEGRGGRKTAQRRGSA